MGAERMGLLLVLVLVASVQGSPVFDSIRLVPGTRSVPTLDSAPQLRKDSRIVNGNVAIRGQFPYQAALIIDAITFCGGSLITETMVVTAAHCVEGASDVEVYLGTQSINIVNETGREIIPAKTIRVHETYDSVTLNNDIALVELSQTVTFNSYISTIVVAGGDSSYESVSAIVSGWGKTVDNTPNISDQLRYVSLPVISNSVCYTYYGSVISSSKICTDGYYGNACTGDSGGPLVYGSYLIGIVSFGSSDGCEKAAPSVYTRVTSHHTWIAKHAGISTA